jgi:hypothetical protein
MDDAGATDALQLYCAASRDLRDVVRRQCVGTLSFDLLEEAPRTARSSGWGTKSIEDRVKRCLGDDNYGSCVATRVHFLFACMQWMYDDDYIPVKASTVYERMDKSGLDESVLEFVLTPKKALAQPDMDLLGAMTLKERKDCILNRWRVDPDSLVTQMVQHCAGGNRMVKGLSRITLPHTLFDNLHQVCQRARAVANEEIDFLPNFHLPLDFW